MLFHCCDETKLFPEPCEILDTSTPPQAQSLSHYSETSARVEEQGTNLNSPCVGHGGLRACARFLLVGFSRARAGRNFGRRPRERLPEAGPRRAREPRRRRRRREREGRGWRAESRGRRRRRRVRRRVGEGREKGFRVLEAMARGFLPSNRVFVRGSACK